MDLAHWIVGFEGAALVSASVGFAGHVAGSHTMAWSNKEPIDRRDFWPSAVALGAGGAFVFIGF